MGRTADARLLQVIAVYDCGEKGANAYEDVFVSRSCEFEERYGRT